MGRGRGIAVALMTLTFASLAAAGEKVLIYDEQRGIIFVDKDTREPVEKKPSAKQPSTPQVSPRTVAPRKPSPRAKSDIHVGRRKDPPQVYFESGLEYFRNGDHRNALRNFVHADSLEPDPLYALWVGKSYRQLRKPEQLKLTMKKILNTYPESDVADDALFEIAFHYQTSYDYHKAIETYTRLAEQYPFGTSYSNGEKFLELAREQRQLMRAEMISTLNLLGYRGENLGDLYRQFQRSNGLEATGRGNARTVKAIKAEHAAMLEREARQAERERMLRKQLVWALVAGGVLLINCIVAIGVMVSLKSKHARLDSIQQGLAQLDANRL